MDEILDFYLAEASEAQLESLEESSNRLLESGNERQREVARRRLDAIQGERRDRERERHRRMIAPGLRSSRES